MTADPLLGATLGTYAIHDRLGAGGMGVVYRATDMALRRSVALKVLAEHMLDDAGARQRFQREIQTALSVEHPNVVPVYQAGYEDGRFFIAMRLVEGDDLAAVIARGPLSVTRALALLSQVGGALAHVHRMRLVHRDVKPQNILVSHEGEAHEYALLADFGIARALDRSTALTRGIIGSAPYIAPEILEWKPATPASDQYSLACVLFEMLTGRGPFNEHELPAAHLHEPVPDIRSLAPNVPAAIGECLVRALQKNPDHRFADIDEFVAALRRPPMPPATGLAGPSNGLSTTTSDDASQSTRDPTDIDPSHSRESRRRGPFRRREQHALITWFRRYAWMTWAVLPWLNGIAWLHAGISARWRAGYAFAALYSVPIAAAVIEEVTGRDTISTPVAVAAVFSWLIGMTHAWRSRQRVAAKVDARARG